MLWRRRTTLFASAPPVDGHPPRSFFSGLWRLCSHSLILLWPLTAQPGTFALQPGDDVVGELSSITARYEDTLSDIARRYDLGYDEIVQVNPDVDPWLPGDGKRIRLPTQFVLPDAPRNGIALNLAEMRLYYYPRPKAGEPAVVITHPVGIGREGWSTPVANTRIVAKVPNPSWYPPASIRAEHAAQGDPLPKVVPAGPDNPLGQFALRLGITSVLIHGTNKPYGVGMRVSHGCIRLYPEDIEELFRRIPVNTPVHIVNQPYKVGWKDGELYLEAHALPVDDAQNLQAAMTPLTRAVMAAIGNRDYAVDWDKAQDAASQRLGIPVPMGAESPSVGEVLAQAALRAPEASPEAVTLSRDIQWWVEAGEFAQRARAENLAVTLRQGSPPIPAQPAIDGRTYRVAAGPFNDRHDAEAAARRISARLRLKTRLLSRRPGGPVTLPAAQIPEATLF